MRKIAFIGVGHMAGAILDGTLKSGLVNYEHLVLCDRHPEKCRAYTDRGAVLAESVAAAAETADCVILAVKPQNFPDILPELAALPSIRSKLIVTIAAGITVETVRTALSGAPVVRVLPNTPMIIGQGVSVICRAPDVSPEDFAFVCSLFESSGRVVIIDESEMNRMISVTSSSPAYVFAFIQAMYEGAKAQGLDHPELLDAICDTVIGSAALLKAGDSTPIEQIRRVTSKGGTTERAMNVLNAHDLDGILTEAMQACTDRADELGES